MMKIIIFQLMASGPYGLDGLSVMSHAVGAPLVGSESAQRRNTEDQTAQGRTKSINLVTSMNVQVSVFLKKIDWRMTFKSKRDLIFNACYAISFWSIYMLHFPGCINEFELCLVLNAFQKSSSYENLLKCQSFCIMEISKIIY